MGQSFLKYNKDLKFHSTNSVKVLVYKVACRIAFILIHGIEGSVLIKNIDFFF